MKTPDLSIIIPVYNVQKYIRRCMTSIFRQQGADKSEIIVVDDGSTDYTLPILNKIARHHNNMQIIHQENAGVSVARNTGITASHGKYITFVDGDDIVGINHKAFDEYFPEPLREEFGYISYYETERKTIDKLSAIHFDDKYFVNMLHTAYTTDADIVLGGKIASNTGDSYMLKEIYKERTIRGKLPTDKQSLLLEAEIRESANFALFSRAMLDKYNLRFTPRMNLDEDILFCSLAVLYSDKTATAPDVTYFYNNHPDSLSYIMSDKDNFIKYKNAYIHRFHLLLNTITKQPQYMTKELFGGLKNMFITKYEALFDSTLSYTPNSEEQKKYHKYECQEKRCKKKDCTQCQKAYTFLKRLKSEYCNLIEKTSQNTK